jgi:aarF domain-containing kinase
MEKFSTFLKGNEAFGVPFSIPELTTRKVLTMEMMNGVSIDRVAEMSQEIRSFVAEKVLWLCLKEMMDFRTMQTDPNWSNFLYDKNENKASLFLLLPPLFFVSFSRQLDFFTDQPD